MSSVEVAGYFMWAEASGRRQGELDMQKQANVVVARLDKLLDDIVVDMGKSVSIGQEIVHALKSRNSAYEEMMIGLMRQAGIHEDLSVEELREFIQQSSNLLYPAYVQNEELINQTCVERFFFNEKETFSREKKELDEKRLSVIANADLFSQKINESTRFGELKGFAKPPYPTDHSSMPLAAWIDAFTTDLKGIGLSKMLDGITVNKNGKPVTLQFLSDLARHGDDRVHVEDIEACAVAIAAFWNDLQQQIPALKAEAARKAEAHSKKGFFSKMTDSDDGGIERTRIINIQNKMNEISPEAAAAFNAKLPAYIATAHECNARADALRALFEKQVARIATDEAEMKAFAETLHEAYLKEPKQV